jgi:pantothenate kinase
LHNAVGDESAVVSEILFVYSGFREPQKQFPFYQKLLTNLKSKVDEMAVDIGRSDKSPQKRPQTRPSNPYAEKKTHSTIAGREVALIGVAGVPGAGKSTLAQFLAAELGGIALGMDGFHYALDFLKSTVKPPPSENPYLDSVYWRGAEWTFDKSGFVQALKDIKTLSEKDFHPPLRSEDGKVVKPSARVVHPNVRWPDFDHAAGDPKESYVYFLPKDDKLNTRRSSLKKLPPKVLPVIVEGLYLFH